MAQLLINIQNLIKQNTNLDASNITLTSHKDEKINVFIESNTKLKFKPVTAKAHGKLKSGIIGIPKSDFIKTLDHLIKKNELNSDEAINEWMDKAGKPLGLMPSSAEITKHNQIVGFEEECYSCNGHGEIGCISCNESGEVRCNSCFGSGRITCHGCNGSRYQTCSKCHGNGRNGNTSCSICRGAGRKDCSVCMNFFGGSGQIQCNRCRGGGRVTCSKCAGSGKNDCVTCQTTGIVSEYGRVECEFQSTYKLKVESTDVEINDLLHSLDLSKVAKLGTLFFQGHNYIQSDLSRSYKEVIDLSEINFQIDGNKNLTFNIKAYGSDLEVFDYKNLFGKLLANDTRLLDNDLYLHNVLSFKENKRLAISAKRFLSSEIHLQIADVVVSRKNYSDSGLLGKYDEKSFEDLVLTILGMFNRLVFGKSLIPYFAYQVTLSILFVVSTYFIHDFKTLIASTIFISLLLMFLWQLQLKSFLEKNVHKSFWYLLKKTKLIHSMRWLWISGSIANIWLLYLYLLPLI